MRPLDHSSGCVSNLLLDEWLAQELAPADEARVHQHVRGCAACSARRDQRVRAAGAFLAQAPTFGEHARQHAPGPARRGRSERPRRARWLGLGALVAAAAGVSLWVGRPGVGGLEARPDADAVAQARSKGTARIGFFVKRGERVTRGGAADVLRAGDLLRFTYSVDRASYLALIDVDGRGASVYFPAGSARAAAIAPGVDVPLDFSVELDQTPGEERVHAVFCPRAFALEPVRASLARGRSPELAGCSLDTLVLRKAGPP